jgi:hypothetical protein
MADHPSISNILHFFDSAHLEEELQKWAQPFESLAHHLASAEELAGPELTVGLRKLLEAKDCFVRAAVDAKHGWSE